MNILRSANIWLANVLPGMFYIRLAKIAIPLLDRRRRGFRHNIFWTGSCYCIERDGYHFYFSSPYNVGRYLFSDPELSIEKKMLDKYICGGVLIRDGATVIDIGANVGEFTVAVAEKGAKVYSCEPDPAPFSCLVKNTHLLPRVSCHQVAFGETKGVLPFYRASLSNDSSFVKPVGPVDEILEVEVVLLDDFLSKNKVDKVELLKVEAEGFEPEILRGAHVSLLKRVKNVVVDGGPERAGEPTAEACVEILSQSGFSVIQKEYIVYGYK